MLLMALFVTKKRINELEDLGHLKLSKLKYKVKQTNEQTMKIAKYPGSVVIISKCVKYV